MSSSCSSYLDQGTQKTLVLDLPFAPKRRDLAWRWNKPKNLGRKRWPGARRLKLEPWKSNLLLKTWHCVSSLDVWLLQVVIYLYPQWLKTSIIGIPIKLTIDYSGPRRLCLRRNSWTDCWPTEPKFGWQNQTGWISQVINPSPIPTKDHLPRMCKLKFEIELGKKSQMKNMLHKMVVSVWPCHVWKLPHLRLAWGPWTATVVAKICSWHQWNCPKPTSISRVGEIQIMLDNILWSSSWQYKPRLAHTAQPSTCRLYVNVFHCFCPDLYGFVFANYMNISCRFMRKDLKL